MKLGRLNSHSGNGSMFDAKSIATFWRHLELAVQDGRWKALDYVDVPRRAEAAVATGTVAEAQVSSIPREAVEECGDGWYRWRSFKKQADLRRLPCPACEAWARGDS